MGESLGFEVRTQMTRHPKVFWRFVSTSGTKRKIKLEINTFERSPMLPLTRRALSIDSAWYAGDAEVSVFRVEELCATKVRALYQRSKGRDLFDLWLALTKLGVDPGDIIGAFGAYRPEGLTRGLMEKNLKEKLVNREFCHDCDSLIVGGAEKLGYDAQEAGLLVMDEIVSLI